MLSVGRVCWRRCAEAAATRLPGSLHWLASSRGQDDAQEPVRSYQGEEEDVDAIDVNDGNNIQASWGRSMPREYGVPKDRKLRNLSRGLFMESLKMVGEGATKAGLRCRLGCFCLWKLNFEENDIRRMHLNLGHPFTDECQRSF